MTLPETNIAPKNRTSPKGNSFYNPSVSGANYISFREDYILWNILLAHLYDLARFMIFVHHVLLLKDPLKKPSF